MKSFFSRLRTLNRHKALPRPVIICGLGAEHYRLQSLISSARGYETLALIDDFPWNHGTLVEGVRVYYPSEAPSLIERHGAVALLYVQESDLTLFDRQTRTALDELKIPLIALDPEGTADIDAFLDRRLGG